MRTTGYVRLVAWGMNISQQCPLCNDADDFAHNIHKSDVDVMLSFLDETTVGVLYSLYKICILLDFEV